MNISAIERAVQQAVNHYAGSNYTRDDIETMALSILGTCVPAAVLDDILEEYIHVN